MRLPPPPKMYPANQSGHSPYVTSMAVHTFFSLSTALGPFVLLITSEYLPLRHHTPWHLTHTLPSPCILRLGVGRRAVGVLESNRGCSDTKTAQRESLTAAVRPSEQRPSPLSCSSLTVRCHSRRQASLLFLASRPQEPQEPQERGLRRSCALRCVLTSPFSVCRRSKSHLACCSQGPVLRTHAVTGGQDRVKWEDR